MRAELGIAGTCVWEREYPSPRTDLGQPELSMSHWDWTQWGEGGQEVTSLGPGFSITRAHLSWVGREEGPRTRKSRCGSGCGIFLLEHHVTALGGGGRGGLWLSTKTVSICTAFLGFPFCSPSVSEVLPEDPLPNSDSEAGPEGGTVLAPGAERGFVVREPDTGQVRFRAEHPSTWSFTFQWLQRFRLCDWVQSGGVLHSPPVTAEGLKPWPF